jgi:hypothetical protein
MLHAITQHTEVLTKNEDSRSPFGAWRYLALTLTYQPKTLSASPNQDRSLRLTCFSLDGFPSSIYDYKQDFINYKDL